MAIFRVRVSIISPIFLLLTLLFLSTLDRVSSSEADVLRQSNRNLLVVRSRSGSISNEFPNCKEMSSKLECVRNAKCRWCRSDSIDDMCFSSTEAWRLPQQVFACD